MASTDLKTHTVDAAGTDIAYWESGSGHPVVFVHGNFASKRWFRAQLEAPIERYRFVALDLPNFGESAHLGQEASLEHYAATLAAFLNELGIERAVLVGHSMGGAVTQKFAVDHPDMIAGMLLVASPPPSGFDTPPGTEEAQRALRASAEQMGQALAATMPTSRPDDYDQIVSDALALPVETYGPHNRSLAAMDLTDLTERVETPVWILRGEQDYLITEAMARELAGAYPDTHLELWDGVGHSPQIEDPERFGHLLETFLEGVDMT